MGTHTGGSMGTHTGGNMGGNMSAQAGGDMNTQIRPIIRPIKPSEYPLLEDFHYMTISAPPGAAPHPRDIIYQPKSYQYIKDFGRLNDFCVVAEVDNRVVGAAWTRFIRGYGFVDDETPELAIAVLPEYRGRGLGSAMLESLHKIVRDRGNWAISLAVEKTNPAVHLYQRMGYQTVAENDDDFIMVKSFAPERMDDFFNSRIDIYDRHMLDDMKLDGVYREIASLIKPSQPDFQLLDLGCGTGLELEPLFERFPDMRVTGIDMSSHMLARLQAKFPDKKMKLIQGSFFSEGFGSGYDFALSTYALHHFTGDEKLELYAKICCALKPGAKFLLGDYTVPTQEIQEKLYASSVRLRARCGIGDGEAYHIDIPLAVGTETRLMEQAGFAETRIIRQWENGSIIVATKG